MTLRRVKDSPSQVAALAESNRDRTRVRFRVLEIRDAHTKQVQVRSHLFALIDQ